MPGWLSRAAAWASRSTRRPGLAALLDRLDRDRALEAAVPGLVDDAEAAAADAALDQEAVEDEGADQSSFDFAARAALLRCRAGKNAPFAAVLTLRPRQVHTLRPANQLGEPLLGGFASTRAAAPRAAHNADPNASRSCCGAASRSAAA